MQAVAVIPEGKVKSLIESVSVGSIRAFPYYIEPRPESLNRALSAAHLAGSTAKKLRRTKLSSTKGNAQGKSKLVSYVPLTLLHEAGIQVNNAYPEQNPHVSVNEKTKKGSYKTFTWTIR